jgi:nitrate reductase NapE component
MAFTEIIFTRPECVALNRAGEMSPKQRKKFWVNILVAVACTAMVLVLAVVCWYGSSPWMAALLAGSSVLVGTEIRNNLQIYRDPKPQIIVKRGLLQNINRIPYGRGGTVGVGQETVFLRKDQLIELRFGHVYEIFVIMPYQIAVSAHAVDID